MNYILIGLLLSIGWGVGSFITDVLLEAVIVRLKQNKTFCRLIGKPVQNDKKESPYQNRGMGFLK